MKIVTGLVILCPMSVMAAPHPFPGSVKRLHLRNMDDLHPTKYLKPVKLPTTQHLTVGVANATQSSLYPEPTKDIVVVTTRDDLEVKANALSQISSSVEILEWRNLGEAADKEMVTELKNKGILTVSSMSVPCKKEEKRAIPELTTHANAAPDVMVLSSNKVSLDGLLNNILKAKFEIQRLIYNSYCVHKDVMVVTEELNLSCEEFQEKFNKSHWPSLSFNHTTPTNATYVLNDLLQGHLSYRKVLHETITVQTEFSCCNKPQCYFPQYCIDGKLVNALECDWLVWQEDMDDALEGCLLERAIGTYYEVMRLSGIDIYAKAEELPAHQEPRPQHYPILYTATGLFRHLHQMKLAEHGLDQLCHKYCEDWPICDQCNF